MKPNYRNSVVSLSELCFHKVKIRSVTRLNWKEETGGREAGEAILIIAYTEVTRAQSHQAGDEAEGQEGRSSLF